MRGHLSVLRDNSRLVVLAEPGQLCPLLGGKGGGDLGCLLCSRSGSEA